MTTQLIEKRHPLKTATRLAINVWEILRPHCLKCKVAGSIARKKERVKDIEIVCVPKTITGPDGLFDTKDVRSPDFIEALEKLGEKKKGNYVEGKFIQIWLPEHEIMVDVFCVEKGNFGMQHMIRTGPAEFSKMMLYKFTLKGFHSVGGYPTHPRLGKLSFENEKEVFKYLNMEYIRPENRK